MQNALANPSPRRKHRDTVHAEHATEMAVIPRLGALLLTALLVISSTLQAQGWTEIRTFHNLGAGAYRYAFDEVHGHVVGVPLDAVSATLLFDGQSVTFGQLFPSPGGQVSISELVLDPQTQQVSCLVSGGVFPNYVHRVASWNGAQWNIRQIPGMSGATTQFFNLVVDTTAGRMLAFNVNASPALHFYIDTAVAIPAATSVPHQPQLLGSFLYCFMDAGHQSPVLVTSQNIGFPTSATVIRTYRWTGTSWTQTFPTWPYATSPSSGQGTKLASSTLASGAMAFHYTIEAATNTIRPRTVRYSGGVATEMFVTSYPPEANYELIWASTHGCYYAVSSNNPNVWKLTLGSNAQVSTIGTGCPGSRGAPTLAPQQGSTPRIGTTFVLQSLNLPLSGPVFLALGASDTLYGPTPLPLNLAPLGAPQCNLLVSIDNLFPSTNILGAATWGFPIPNIPGGVFFTQAVVFDQPANAFGITLSNAVRGVVGS